MGVKDDILDELSNIPLEVMKPADSTNYDRQQIEKDSWGRLLNTQTFKQFENSINSLKGSCIYTLNNPVELTYFDNEILRLDNKDIYLNSLITEKLDITTYNSKMTELDAKDTLLQTQLNNSLSTYVLKTDYNSKVTQLENNDNNLFDLVSSKVDTNTYTSDKSLLITNLNNKVDLSTYNLKINSIETKNTSQDTSISNLQTSKADLTYVDSKVSTINSTNSSQDSLISNLQTTKANISDVVLKTEILGILSPYVTSTYANSTYLTITNANNNFVGLTQFNSSQTIQNNLISNLQTTKIGYDDAFTKSQSDIRYVLRSEWNGETGGGTGEVGVDHSIYATWEGVYSKQNTYSRTEFDNSLSLILSNYLTISNANDTFLKLSGGTLSGNLYLKDGSNLGSTFLTNNSVNSNLFKRNQFYSKEIYTTIDEVDYTKILYMPAVEHLEFGSPTLDLSIKSLTSNIPINDTRMTVDSDFEYFTKNINFTHNSYLKMASTSTVNAGASLVDGRVNGNLIYGDLSKNIELKGNTTRPKYNGVDLALKSDIKSKNEYINGSFQLGGINASMTNGVNTLNLDILNYNIIDVPKKYSLYYIELEIYTQYNGDLPYIFNFLLVDNVINRFSQYNDYTCTVDLEGSNFYINIIKQNEDFFNIYQVNITKLFGIG